ncbi:unnamed protein product [Brachionus calyciflorus]|uniref:Uncharacterized protein n=1 Tax=Brachionus calyciflorus TaxID=104777 RepID=A0A813YWC4_9BILA|nr:unnamed protein product [Brachionus calyciflorus]
MQVVSDFQIDQKTFKILADQSANNKKAFQNTKECDLVVDVAIELILNQRALNRAENRKFLKNKVKQVKLVNGLNI